MESLTHSKWECKYHVVFVPKYRKKVLYGKIRLYLKKVFHELARQKGCKIESGSMVRDHVHMCISIPPKYAVSEVIGYLKGKSAIQLQDSLEEERGIFQERSFGQEDMLFQQ